MTNLESLLREWAVLEPDRCELESGPNRFFFKQADLFIYGSDFNSIDEDDRDHADGELLHPLRQAIEARGWSWATGFKGWKYYGRVMGNEVEGERPVEALLEAYIQEVENDKP